MVFQFVPFVVKLLITIAIQAAGYALLARGGKQMSQKFENMESPTAEEGAPVPVLFGEMWVSSPNILWTGDKETTKRKIKA